MATPGVSEADLAMPIEYRDFREPVRRELKLVPPVSEAPAQDIRERVLSRRQTALHLLVGAGWILVCVKFWWWWLAGLSVKTAWLYWPQTLAFIYDTTILPTLVWYFALRMRRPRPVPAQEGLNVALVTLCVPSHESLEVIGRQLRALTQVSYPHTSWVLDEGDSPEVRTLAEALGVNYFTRRGIERWNQAGPPFQRATKAGNVNAWLDHVAALGLDYDVFVQLDIDHRPRTDYLDRVLGYFEDPKVAWVQAPSVYSNLQSWTSRGAQEQDLLFHGPLQMGFYGAAQTPIIVGSHSSYRTSAIREIGGFQPTRAEDHLDTVVLAAAGYRGVFVPEVIATGEGPEDFATYLRQQSAWAYSMTQIMLHKMPRFVRRHRPGQAFLLLVCQTWYVLSSASMLLLWALPLVALLTNRTSTSTTLGTFALYFLPLPLYSLVLWRWLRRWANPSGLPMTWRTPVLCFARVPVVLWAVIAAAIGHRRPYMITPKGIGGGRSNLVRAYWLYTALALIPLVVIEVSQLLLHSYLARGYIVFALLDAALAATVLGVGLLGEVKGRRGRAARTVPVVKPRLAESQP